MDKIWIMFLFILDNVDNISNQIGYIDFIEKSIYRKLFNIVNSFLLSNPVIESENTENMSFILSENCCYRHLFLIDSYTSITLLYGIEVIATFLCRKLVIDNFSIQNRI